jgi:hypothetical protein
MVIDLVLGNAKLNKSGWLLQLDLASPGGQNLTALGNQAFLGSSFPSPQFGSILTVAALQEPYSSPSSPNLNRDCKC